MIDEEENISYRSLECELQREKAQFPPADKIRMNKLPS